MKQIKTLKCATLFVVFFVFAVACKQTATEETATTKPETDQATTTKADPATLRAEIQELETAWATSDNAGDVNTLATFYSEDAVSLANNAPMLVGNAAIKKDMEASMAKRPKGFTTSYDVMDVFGSGDYVTEVGKTTRKDSTGKVTTTGKYMAIWEKRNGKWICIRDISNNDAKDK